MVNALSLITVAFGVLSTCVAECNATSKKQRMSLPFELAGKDGLFKLSIEPNEDLVHGNGLDLVYPQIPPSQYEQNFIGFPVIHGTIQYPIPTEDPSFNAMFGWIELVKFDKDGVKGNYTTGHYPWQYPINSPFGYWGYKPEIFDIPAQSLAQQGNVTDLVFTAQVFLTVLADAGDLRNVSIVPGACFTYGYEAKQGANGRTVSLVPATTFDAPTEWSKNINFLTNKYPTWTFMEYSS